MMIKKLYILTCAAILCGNLTGCWVLTSPQSSVLPIDTVAKRLKVGHTTEAEVRGWIGEPLTKKKTNGNFTVWSYEEAYQETLSAQSSSKIGGERDFSQQTGFRHTIVVRKTMTLIFTGDGILQNYQIIAPKH